MPEEVLIQQIEIKVNGADIPRALMDMLVEAVVDSSLHLPSMFTLRFHDNELQWVDSGPFSLGAPVEIAMAEVSSNGNGRPQMTPLFKGEITAIEPDFDDGVTAMLTVRGYDRSHRLNRESKSKVFLQTTDSDIVSQVASGAGLQAQTERTSEVYKHVFQDNQTDLAFLHRRAERIGFEVFVDDRTLHFRRQTGQRGSLDLEWGVGLRSFHPRLSLAGQVDEVVVKGWDPKKKQAIVGQATESDTAPEIGVGQWGGQAASQAISSAKRVTVRRPVASQADADAVAKALLDEINAGFIEAEGEASGNPRLLAGGTVNLRRLGGRFSGRYWVTSATHIYSPEGYVTRFAVQGRRPTLMADLVDNAPSNGRQDVPWGGVVPAIVTNNNDSEDMGRVKVKFPWLDGQLESDWARVSGVGAGKERGLYWLPEVNDEVLVAFEHGDFNRPFVIGGLWNGEDKPPERIGEAVKSGKVHTRTIKTRTGHVIRLVDDESGDQYIEIIDAAQGTHIKLDAKNKALSIKCQRNVTIEASGAVTLTAQRDLAIEATGELKLKGRTVKLEGDTNVDVNANANLTLKGSAQFSAEGGATAELKAGGNVTVRGALVQIN